MLSINTLTTMLSNKNFVYHNLLTIALRDLQN